MPPSSTPHFAKHERLISEPEGFGDAVSGMELSVAYRHRQVRPSRVIQFRSPRLGMDFGELHAKSHLRGIMPEDSASICFLRGPGNAIFNGLRGEAGTLFYLPPGAELNGCADPGMSWVTMAIPAGIWETCGTIAGADRFPVRHQPGWKPSPALGQQLFRMLAAVERDLSMAGDDPNRAARALTKAGTFARHCAVIAWEQSTRAGSRRECTRNRCRLAKRAHDWMLAHLEQDVDVGLLCLEFGVSRRELEYAFRTILNTSPAEHLKILRLNEIRRALRDPALSRQSVSRIALRFGMTHLGRFASQYRMLFGETPSQSRNPRRG